MKHGIKFKNMHLAWIIISLTLFGLTGIAGSAFQSVILPTFAQNELPENYQLDVPFQIKMNQSVHLEDLELTFGDIEDTRCPLDVNCIWEGDITVWMGIKNQTHRMSGGFTPGYMFSYLTPYEITLVDIQPHPISTEKADYVATMKISKLEKHPEVNHVDFRDASGEIICKGYSSGGGFFEYPECGPVDKFIIHVLVIVLSAVGIVIGFIIWRKRK